MYLVFKEWQRGLKYPELGRITRKAEDKARRVVEDRVFINFNFYSE